MKNVSISTGLAAMVLLLAQAAPGSAQMSAPATSPKCASGDPVVWVNPSKKMYQSSAPVNKGSGANSTSAAYGSGLVNGGYSPMCKSQAVKMGAKMSSTSGSSMKSSSTNAGAMSGSSSMSGKSPAATTPPQGSPMGGQSGNTPGPNGAPPSHSP